MTLNGLLRPCSFVRVGMDAMFLYTVCCYDPQQLQHQLGYMKDPCSEVQPMLTVICESSADAAMVFYNLQSVTYWIGVQMIMSGCFIEFEFNVYGTEALMTVLSSMYIFATPRLQSHEMKNNVVYSSIGWSNTSIRT
jgi:hypothetical protein